MVKSGHLRRGFTCLANRYRSRSRHARWLLYPHPPRFAWRKRGAQNQAIGKSRGGRTTKLHCLVDGLGNPLAFLLTPGDVHDITPAPALLATARARYFIADKAYDSNAFVAAIEAKGMIAVIPSRAGRLAPRPLNKFQYKERHLVENCFAKLKQWRRVATRYEKTARNYLSVVALAAVKIWLA